MHAEMIVNSESGSNGGCTGISVKVVLTRWRNGNQNMDRSQSLHFVRPRLGLSGSGWVPNSDPLACQLT